MPINGNPTTDGANGGASSSSSSSSSRARNRTDGPDTFLVVCRCFRVITSLIAILCIAVNLISAIRSFRDGRDIFDGIFRCYAIVIALFVVIAETEWGFLLKFSKVFEYWVGRGMLQIFVAVMTRAFTYYTPQQRNLFLLQNIASYLLLACGVVYVILGILCIGCLKRARERKESSREQRLKDLKELERRREELEQLLVVAERV